MSKFKIGDRVKDVSSTAPNNPFGTVTYVGGESVKVYWDELKNEGIPETHWSYPETDFELVASSTQTEQSLYDELYKVHKLIAEGAIHGFMDAEWQKELFISQRDRMQVLKEARGE